MATVADVLTYARFLAQTDSGGITDTAGLAFANDAQQNMTRSLMERSIDAAQTKESYATISASDVPPGRFAWPTDMYKLKTVEVNYTDTSQANYIQAQAVDFSNIQAKSFDDLRLNQPSNQPLFDNRGDTGEVVPTPPGTALVRIFYYVQPTEYSATSSTINYPHSLDYRCLSARVAELYALSLGEGAAKSRYAVSLVSAMGKEYETRLDSIIKILAPSSQQPVQAQPLRIDGWSL